MFTHIIGASILLIVLCGCSTRGERHSSDPPTEFYSFRNFDRSHPGDLVTPESSLREIELVKAAVRSQLAERCSATLDFDDSTLQIYSDAPVKRLSGKVSAAPNSDCDPSTWWYVALVEGDKVKLVRIRP